MIAPVPVHCSSITFFQMRRDLEKEVKYRSLVLHDLGPVVGFWPSHISFAWTNIFFKDCLIGWKFCVSQQTGPSASQTSEIYLCPNVLGIYNQRIFVCVINILTLLFMRIWMDMSCTLNLIFELLD